MKTITSRRDFLAKTGVSAAAANFLFGLPSLGWAAAGGTPKKKRIVFIFSPNGVIPDHFWPSQLGSDYDIKRILQPLSDFKNRMMTLHGVCNKIRGDGDGHMRGMGCLLTGIELFPGDVQGGSDTPAGWAKGISIDQHIKNHFQSRAETQTRFGSLEFGVMVPERADTWTRMSYAGANQPVAPIDNPYRMFDKLYGQTKNRELLASVLDDLVDDFKKVEQMVSSEDRRILNDHLEMVRELEVELRSELTFSGSSDTNAPSDVGHAVPELPANIEKVNDNMPLIMKMQMDMMVSSFAADFARVASLQITNSVGEPKMRWIDIEEGHHHLSHEPDSNADAYEKLIKINTWYAEQVAYLAKRLAETPEPDGDGSLLDNTTIVWTNELGKGDTHTPNNIPFVLVGEGCGFTMGRALDFEGVAHNRLLMNFSESMGISVPSFGNPDYCGDGPLTGLVV